MNSIKIETIPLGIQFAYGGTSSHPKPPRNAVLTRKGAAYLLTIHPGTKDALSTEQRPNTSIRVDYTNPDAKICSQDPDHGPKTANPSGRLTCPTCHAAYHAAKKQTKTRPDAAVKADARAHILDAKATRLMDILTTEGIPQAEKVTA